MLPNASTADPARIPWQTIMRWKRQASAGKVLGRAAVGGKAKTYVDWKKRLPEMVRAEAKRLGLLWATMMRSKKRVFSGLSLTNGTEGARCLD
jgi:hypothetical protein